MTIRRARGYNVSGKGLYSVEDVIINVNILPDILCRRIRGKRVKIHEADGIVSLIPIETASNTPIADSLVGLLNGTGIKNADDIKNMRLGL